MSTFRELLEGKMIERCHHFNENELRHFMAGARAALEIAAEDIKTDLDPYVPQTRNWLRTLASSLSPASEREGGG